jgi:outer membrane protein assembly factor BamA
VVRFLVVLLALAACGGSTTTRVHKPGDEWLKSIKIEGNHAIPSDDLIPGLSMYRTQQREGAIDDYQLSLDVQRLSASFQKLGFFSVTVKPRLEKHGDATTIVFEVTEGPRATVKIELVGLPPEVTADQARSALELHDGDPFDYDKYDDAKAPLTRLVEDAGYAHVQLDATVIADRSASHAIVRYVLDPGPRCTFGAVEIDGAEGVLAKSVRDRLAFAPGQPFSATALDTTREDLYSARLFTSVRVDAQRDVEGTVIPIKVTVGHGDLNEIRFGFGGGIDPITKFLRARLQYTRLRFLTPLTTLVGDLRPEYAFENCGWDLWNCTPELRGRASVKLTQQDLIRRDVKGDVELGYEYLIIEAYTRYGPHTSLGLTLPLDRRVHLRLGWQYSYTQFQDFKVGPAEVQKLGIDHPSSVGAYTGSLVLDLRDRPVEPRNGFYAELRGAVGTPFALGDFTYTELVPDVRAFYSIGKTTFAARARIGRIAGDVPAIERFYGGGVSSHRGFSPRHLSPVDPATGIVVGGAGLMESSFEIRRPLISPWGIDIGGVAFIDAGDVTETFSELDPANPYLASGVALGWFSPIGPIGFSVARRLNRTGPGNDEPGNHWNWEFVVGEAF